MSLTSYQTAPPRDLEIGIMAAIPMNANGEFAPARSADKILAASIFEGKVYALLSEGENPA